MPDGPVQILSFGADGEIEFHRQTLKALVSPVKDKPIAVVSIAGDFRKGKSFMLNLLLKYLRAKDKRRWLEGGLEDGFEWKFGLQRSTRGIVAWPETFLVGDVAVLLVDTQGTFDDESEMKDNPIIFAFSTLLSSLQIFNVAKRIDLKALTNLEFFAEYGTLASGGSVSRPFQELMFLVRDWEYPEDFPHGLDGEEGYLEDLFNDDQDGTGTEDMSTIKDTLERCFERISCFLMPHPGEKVAMGKEFSGEIADIDETFLEHVESLASHVVGQGGVVTKKVGGSDVTAGQLVPLMAKYAELFRGNQLPELQSLLNVLARDVLSRGLDEAKKRYRDVMLEVTRGGHVDNLTSLHEDARQEAHSQLIGTKRVGDEALVQDYEQRLEQFMAEELKRRQLVNEERREAANLEKEAQKAKLESEKLQNDMSAVEASIAGKRSELEDQKEECEKLNVDHEKSRQILEQMEQKTAEIEDQAKEVESKERELHTEISELINEAEEDESKIQELIEDSMKSEGFMKSLGKTFGYVLQTPAVGLLKAVNFLGFKLKK